MVANMEGGSQGLNGHRDHGKHATNGVEFAREKDLRRIWEWNKQVPETLEQCIHTIFAQRVKEYPEAPAICAWDGDLTYSQLDELSTKLAHHLISLGLTTGSLVPLCLEKSVWMSVAVLGVMKAGGASVALDVTLPEGRLRTIAEQTKSTLIVSSPMSQELARQIMGDDTMVVIPELLQSKQLSNDDMQTALPVVSPSGKLYVVFTSGSTGTPKGAIITHSNFASAHLHEQRALGFTRESRVWDFVSYAFDVSWSNILHTLTSGACLCVPSQEQRQSDIAGSIRKLRVNLADITPSIGRLMDPAQVPGLQLVNFSGEILTTDDVTRWRSVPTVLNSYGPAECSVRSTAGNPIDCDAPDMSIGWSIGSNSWVAEPEKGQELVPIGSIGELWLEGPIVGSGYLGDPEKTAATFVQDPIWLLRGGPGVPGRHGRLYKTGDLVKYNDNGSLEFIGRKDSQVKIRGQRVELDEVEHHVRKNLVNGADIQMVAEVITPEGRDPMLVIFVKVNANHHPTEAEQRKAIMELTSGLEAKLAEDLPSYEIPVAYIPVAQIPMTATGKTDRRQLRSMGASMTLEHLANLNPTRGEKREPSTEMERKLQMLWAAILRVEPGTISANDSFTRIGGDSIAMIQLVAAAREEGLVFSVADIFKQARLVDLAKVVREARADYSDIIEPFSLLSAKGREHDALNAAARSCSVEPARIEDIFPCTPLQEGLLALTVKSSETGGYTSRNVLPLRDDVDLDKFIRAWEHLVASTPILRTRIIDLPGEKSLTQAVVAEKLQWRHAQDIESLIKEDELEPMGLGKPLARFGIVNNTQSPGGKRYFMWTIHHALYDGWLMALLTEHAERDYRHEPTRKLTSFPSFIKHGLNIDRDSVTKYWQFQLADSEAVSYPATPPASYEASAGQTLYHEIDEVSWPRTGITPTTAVRAAWTILSSRYSNSRAVVFGATIAGRQGSLLGVEYVAGPTIATVPIQLRIENGQTIESLLQKIQNQAIDMADFEQTGLQRIRSISSDLSQASQFQTLVVVQPPKQEVNSAMFEDGQTNIGNDGGLGVLQTYPLTLECQLTKAGLLLKMRYDSGLVQQPERLARQFELVLHQICDAARAETKLADVELLTEQDLGDILKWNSASQIDILDSCIHDIVSQKAQVEPNRSAICAWDGKLTFAELDNLSTRLAQHLLRSGVNRGDMVPICFEKSLWVTVAMLGVNKAGAAFVPLDPSFPKARKDDILSQTEACVIVTSASNASTFSESSLYHTVVVSAEMFRGITDGVNGVQNHVNVSDPGSIAYVIFTSGSTGRPKGVVMEHRAVVTSCKAHGRALKFGPYTRSLQFSSYTFDACVIEIVTTLMYGGCVCIPSDSERVSDLASAMNRFQVTWALLTPTVARLLEPKELTSLRQLALGAEAVLEQDLARWKDSVHLFEAYGPTECAVICFVQDFGLNPSSSSSVIGKGEGAISWLVDPQDHNKLAPLGAIGELLIQGPNLARGYLGDERKTAEAFIEDPAWLQRIPDGQFQSQRPVRMYKTGDLVRYQQDGSLEFIGRKDVQTKIRGQRVELGDVEHHIRDILKGLAQEKAETSGSDISAVAEIIIPQSSSTPILVVFFGQETSTATQSEEENCSLIQPELAAELEQALTERLPIYMIPAAFIRINAIPLTLSGKTDRKRLRSTGALMTLEQLTARTSAESKRQPTTEMERQLQSLWASVLDIDQSRIGTDDNFLRIGGDSVSAMRLAAAAHKQNLSLTVASVLKHPRLSQLAQVVTKSNSTIEEHVGAFSQLRTESSRDEARLQAARICEVAVDGIEDIFPCTPLQQGLLALTAKRQGDYIHQERLNIKPDVNTSRLRVAWEEVILTTPILRTRIIDLPGQGLVQVVLSANQVGWTKIDEETGIAFATGDRDLAMGLGTPLARFSLIGNSFLLTLHHAVYDGWSLSLIFQQLEKAYQNLQIEASPPFQRFVKHILGVEQERMTGYWQHQLDGAESAALFPTLPSTSYDPQTDEQIVRQISNVSWNKTDMTASTIIRAAWTILFARYMDTIDVVFGAVVMGRRVANVSGIEHMIGPTIATVPVRILLDWHQTIDSLLKQVQAQTTEMAEFEHVGLGRIRQINRDCELATQFQTLVAVQPKDMSNDSIIFKPRDEGAADIDAMAAFGTYAFTPVCNLEADGLQLQLNFDSHVIESAQVERISCQFEHLVRSLCDPEHSSLSLANIMTANQQDLQDIWAWNAIVPSSADRLVHEMIDETIQSNPLSQAVCAWDGDLTYNELDCLATRVSRHLIENLGIGPGAMVPLYLDKSMWVPVAMLGVMKSGAASVALDVTQPEQRLKAIVDQVNAVTVLCSETNADRASILFPGAKTVKVDSLCSKDEPQAPLPDALVPSVKPTDPVYTVFTSGSTGVPKGVIITHANFTSAFIHQTRQLGFSEKSRVFDFASYAFDASWYHILHTFYAGGCLCIPSEDERRNDTSGAILRMKPTFANLTPKVAELLEPEALKTFELIELGGEGADAKQVAHVKKYTNLRFAYGPAECTVVSTVSEENVSRTTIGRGYGTCTWVIDTVTETSLAPLGCVGELWIEGPMVGRGYLNDPSKTAASFVEDPLWLLHGVSGYPGRHGRLYKTGDLVRYQADGSLIFVGRKDTQVKIRGQRVELSEVEHHIHQCLTSQMSEEGKPYEGLQIVAEVVSDKSKLVAFVVPPGGSHMSDEERELAVKNMVRGLEDRLGAVVPPYMIPAGYIPLRSVPMTTTGKTDRVSLRHIGASANLQTIGPRGQEFVEPQNEVESSIRDTWANVLNMDPSVISTTARFLRLGGDSITAMQVVSRSRQHNIHVTVGEVLGLQTIQRIAESCREKKQSSAVNATASLLQSDDTGKAWPLSPVQRMIFSFHPTGLNHFNQSFILKINRTVEDDDLLTASRSLVARHSMLRARFRQNGDGQWEQYAKPYTPDVYAFRQHGDVQSVDQIESTAQSRQTNFDIQNGPVFAADAFHLMDGQQVMLLSAHHLVVDLVSWRIIWNDMEQCLRGQRLMPPPTSFLAWSQVQQDRSQDLRSPADVLPYEVEPAQPDFWGVKPTDNTVGRQITLEARINLQTTALLLGQSTDALRCEPLDILAAAILHTFQATFSERVRMPPLFIEGHGREIGGDEVADLSETVGWFTTLYPLQVTNDAIHKGNLTHLVKVVKDLRRSVPGKGQPYFATRYNSELGKQSFGAHDQAELLLNYAGVYQQLESSDSVFSRFSKPGGGNFDLKVTSPDVRRVAFIEVEAVVEKDELRMEFIFSKDMKNQKRLERWKKAVEGTLKDMCHQLANESHSFTLADFPLVNISYTGLHALLEEQLAVNGVEVSQIKDIYPCTPLQEGILMSQKRGTASYATNFVWSCESTHDGSLVSPTTLKEAWRLAAQRHSILSTIFVDHPETGGMLQVVLANTEHRIQHLEPGQVDPVQALQSLPVPAFTPSQPQWSVTICSRSGTGQVACRLDISHAMSDAASMSIIAQDVANAYSGQNMPTAPEFREVVDAIHKQPREERLAYWAEFLAEAQPCHFPTIGQVDGSSASDASDEEYGFLPVVAPDVSGQIYDFCRGRGITRSELLQVAWALSLSQCLAVDRVCFGYLTSGRNTRVNNIEQLVGPVINMLVGFIDVSKSLDDVLNKTHGDSINHFGHQHTSLAEIHRELGGFSGKRLFNTTITVLTEDEDQQAKGGAKDLRLQVRGGVDPHEYDLALSASQKGHHTDLVLNYRKGSVSDYTASEVGQLLESAICFILEAADPNSDDVQSANPGTGNLQGDFSRWRFGANDVAVREFWQKQFQDADAVHFPPLPSAEYIAGPDRTLEYDCGKIQLWEEAPWSAMTIALAAWCIVAAEATNSSKLVFGALIESHQTSQKRGGRATTCVPVQVALQGELTVEEFHRLLEEKTDEIAQYPHISLQEISGTSEAAKHCCQFQTLVSVQSTTRTPQESEVLPNCAMSVNFAQRENNATTLSFSFNTKVVEEELVARLAGRLKHVMQQQSDPAHASTRIADLTVAGEQDLNDIWQWNAIVPTAADQCVHEMFTETATKRPTAPAVCAWNGQLTYGELDLLSTRLAYHLISLGVGPESVVPLCFEKSLFTSVAMLAVMKAGAASVALDVTQPEERLRAIFKQVNAKITLSSVGGAQLASHLGGSEIPNISIDKEGLLALPAVELSSSDAVQLSLPIIDSSSMIYLAFTSGSTGEPKGVMITHSNFASAIRYQREALGFNPSSRVYDFASYAFDVAWYNAFQTLTAGGCLCVPSEHQRKNELPASIVELQANSITLTPTVAELLDASILKRLRIVELGGEAVKEAHIDHISAHTKVRIAYGPVECTAGATWASKDIHDSNIGHPLGACVWVVDAASSGRLAAVGSIGELWIEGPLVGRGYLNDPAKTAGSFVEDPPWLLRGSPEHGQPGRRGRLYKTGDLVRQRADGSLIFVGRKDAQVKLRGQRVELTEVEHHIRKILAEDGISGVSATAEVISPEQRSSPILVAFLSANKTHGHIAEEQLTDATSSLEHKLGERVPAYMVPAAYIAVDSIPTTATGKTDRRQLRRIGSSITMQQLAELDPLHKKRRPFTNMEQRLQGLWAEVLDMDGAIIGAGDSFLHMGDSIAAMQLVAKARLQGLALTVADVFKQPRLCDMAKMAKQSLRQEEPVEPFSLLNQGNQTEDARRRAAAMCGVNASQIEDLFPCTPLQEGLLALTAKRTGDYINHAVLRLQDSIDENRFRTSVEEVAFSTASILRARIVSLPYQGSVQAIVKEPLSWSTGNSINDIVRQHNEVPMDLGKPLVRYGIAKDPSHDGIYFVLTLHHALYDGWSMQLLLEQIARAYCSQQQSKNRPLQFQSFVQSITRLNHNSITNYWERQLEDCGAPTYPPLPSASYQPRIDDSVFHTVSDLKWPQRSNITPSTLVRAAWALVVASYTNSSDVLFGAIVTGRQAAVPGVEYMIGPTIATVPIRTLLDWDQSVSKLLQQVQAQGVEMTEFEQTGLQQIRRIRDCQFQTLLVVQPAHTSQDYVENTVFELDTQERSTAATAFGTYAISVECQLEDNGLGLQLHFDSNIIADAQQPKRMSQQFEHLLRQLCDPSKGVSKLSQLQRISSHDLETVWQWNATVPATAGQCVHDLFTQMAQQQPQAPAIHAWNGNLTYGEVETLSNRLAHRLIDLGVSPGTIIPLCFEKSVWTSVAMLAVMKVGATSVALDVTQPEDRLWAIISQVRPGLTISSNAGVNIMARLASRIPEYKSNVVVNQDEILFMPLEGESLPVVDASTALYLAFTSGSTGEPKGVIITHNNFSSGIKHQQKSLGFSPEARVYDFASYAFDVSWYNAFQTLCAGGCLCVPSEDQRKNDLSRSILDLGANRVTLTSTVLDVLEDSVIRKLDLVETGGEAVSQRQIDRVAQSTQCRIAYGPVECTVGVTWAWGDLSGRDIGKGLGACTWVVDPSSGSLTGVGCIGELWIEGPLVGRGYLNDPAKTAESFVEDPDWLVQGSPGLPGRRGRLYKTGDLVRYKPDGSLVFVGRKDTQVKLRGQRIELGEVEHHVLAQLVGRDSGTTERGDAPQVVAEVIRLQSGNSDMLIVFVSPSGGGSMSEDDCARAVEELTAGISRRLADVVPVYMVPSGYIPIQIMPRMTTGKTDRRLLRQRVEKLSPQELATLMSPLSSQSRRPVSTTAERQLQQLWADILGLAPETITADDSFFQLGGDSVHAMRLAGAARSQDLVLTVADIFSSPYLSSQARLLRAESCTEVSIEPFSLLGSDADTATARKDAALLCNVAESQINDIFPCTSLQEGLLAMTARRPRDYINHTVRELQSNIDPLQFQRSWEALVAATPILRTRVVDLPSYGLVQVVIQEPVKWLTYDDASSSLAQQQYEQLAMGLGATLSQVGLYTDPETSKTNFVWSIHHVLYDGWSIPLLLDAVEKIHADAWSGSLIAPFQPFIKHVVESTSGGAADQFWKNQFAGCQAPQFPSVPSAGFQPRADTILDRRVEQLGQSPSGFTMATTVRAAWAALLSNATNSPDVVFGAVVSGRQAPVRDIERMAGPTIATVPVRALLDRNMELRSLLSEFQDNATHMTQFEQTGLQNIQRVSPEAQEACRFQTLLVVQPARQESNDTTGTVFESTRALDDGALGGTDGFSTYALMLTCEQSRQDLELSLSIDSRIIEHSRGERLLDQFEHIIRQLCSPENAHARLGNINMLSPRDLHDIWTWNAVLPTTSSNCVHSLFSQTAQRQPSALAVEAWDGTLTYGELDGKSTRLAHHLLGLGIDTTSQPIIPLCFEKSVWTPVAMLAVMKIGAAAVALDVTQPEGRLLSIINQAKPTITISSAQGAALMSRISSCINITVDETMFSEPPPVTRKEPPLPQVSPESTLYLAFTSGSTGEPKGVMISHSNFSSLVQHQGHMFSSDCRVFDFASYAFDVAWYNIFQTLIAGGCLCTPSESDRKNDIAGSITRLRANQATLTSTVTDILPDSVVQGLRVIETGGEAVTQAQIDRLTSLTKVRIAYGPVECTIGVTWAVEDLADRAIGRGYGACTWIVDTTTPEPTLASVGSVGELWIEGPLVGQGYLNDLDKTAASFVQDPSFLARGYSTGCPGRKGSLYKTGDLVRYNENGSLTFVGRKDTQIKIRGQRVELSEVEHHISQQLRDNEVQVVAEVATPRGGDTTALVVFIMPAGAETMTEEELSKTVTDMTQGLNSRLSAVVPIYMVPFGYIPLRSVPMMATGKADRRQLRQQISSRSTQELSALVTARSHKRPLATTEEKELQKLWAVVLNLDPENIAADDSFLGVGGDSIQAMRLAAAAQREGWSLSVADILSKSLLFEMAQCLSLTSTVSATRVDPFSLLELNDVDSFVNTQVPQLLPAGYGPVEDILPVSHTQKTFLTGSLDGTPVGIHNFFLDLPSSVDISRLAKSCARLIQNFEILRTVFISGGDNYYQVVLRYLPVSFEVRDVQDDLSTSFGLVCRELDGQLPSFGRTFLRFVLLRTDEGHMRLVIRIFHGQYDGLGFGRLLVSLADLYHGKSIPQEPSLSSLISAQQSPLDYSHWNSLLQDSSMSYMTNPTTLQQNGDESSFKIIWVERTIDAPRMVEGSGSTPATVFTVACATTIASVTGSRDVLFGRVLSGRGAIPLALRDVVFPCITTLPVRARLDSDGSQPETLAAEIQSQYIKGLGFENIGVDHLRAHCASWPEDASEFGIVTQYQNVEENPILELDGASVPIQHYRSAADERRRSNTVQIVAVPVDTELKLIMSAKSTICDEGFLESAMDKLCGTLGHG